MIERGGNLICKVVPNKDMTTLIPLIKKYVKEKSDIMTDKLTTYNSIGRKYNRQVITHRKKVYVNGSIHTNTIEGFGVFLKRDLKEFIIW